MAKSHKAKKKPAKKDMTTLSSGLEEVTYPCPSCGRTVKTFKESTEPLVIMPCERCEKGEADTEREY